MASLKRILGGLILFIASLLPAQVQQPANGGTGTGTAPSAGQILVGQSTGKYAPKTATGACSISSAGAFSCSGGGGGIVPVQKFLEYDCGSMAGNCNSIATPAPVTPGDLLIIEMQHSNGGTVSLSDTNGDVFVAGNFQLVAAEFDLWQFVVCSAVGGATTVNLGTSPDFNVVAIYEFPPVRSSGCIDGYNSAQGNNLASLSTGTTTVNYAQDLIFVSGGTRTGLGGSTITEGNGYTALESSGLVDAALTYNSWYGTMPGTGSLSDTLGYTNNPGGLYAGLLAIKPAANPQPPYTGTSPIVVTGIDISCPTCATGGGGSWTPLSFNSTALTTFPGCSGLNAYQSTSTIPLSYGSALKIQASLARPNTSTTITIAIATAATGVGGYEVSAQSDGNSVLYYFNSGGSQSPIGAAAGSTHTFINAMPTPLEFAVYPMSGSQNFLVGWTMTQTNNATFGGSPFSNEDNTLTLGGSSFYVFVCGPSTASDIVGAVYEATPAPW